MSNLFILFYNFNFFFTFLTSLSLMFIFVSRKKKSILLSAIVHYIATRSSILLSLSFSLSLSLLFSFALSLAICFAIFHSSVAVATIANKRSIVKGPLHRSRRKLINSKEYSPYI